MGNITERTIAGRQSPGIRAVAWKMFGIGDAISTVDQGYVPVVFKIGRSEAIVQAVRVKSEKRVVRKKERAACAHADVEFYVVVGISIRIVIPVFAAGPAFAVSEGPGILAGPPGIVIARGNAVSRRGHREKIGDHHFVEANKRMVDAPGPKGRPVPVQEVAVRCLAEPVPFDAFPEPGDALIERLFFWVRSMKVGARG